MSSDWEIEWGAEIKVVDGDGLDICTVASGAERRGQHTKNAHLLSAASVMLKALRQVLPSVQQREDRLGFELPEGVAIREAIAKATGV